MKRIFESGLEKLGRIIASQYDIRVVFRGTGASTDGKTIYLPSADNLTPELMQDMHGFLDHEVAHCRFTDFKELTKLIKGKGGRFQKDLLNACEDSRIEVLQIEDLPGCRLHLDPLNAKYRGMAEEAIRKMEVPWPVRLIFALRAEMDGREPILDGETVKIFDKVKGDVALMKAARSTEDIRKAAEKITKQVLDLLDDEPESEDGEGDESEDGENGDSEGSEGGEGGEGQDDQESEADGQGKPSQGGKKGKPKPTKRSAKGDRMMEVAEGDESEAWDKAPSNIDDQIGKQLEKHFKENPVGKDPQPPETRAIGGVPDPDRTQIRGRHVPLTTEFDKEIDLTGEGSKATYRRLRAEAKRMTSAIKSKLDRLLKVREESKWRSERDHGSINVRALPRMLTDKNYSTPFREHVKDDVKDVAVYFLVDSSGSMHPKMILTQQTLISMAEALNELGIPFEIGGFTSIPDGNMERVAAQHGIGYDRRAGNYNRFRERLEHRIFKRFDSNDLTGITKLEAGGNNCDPESVKWAANRLALHKAKRKILFVINDGQPATGDSDMRLLRGALKQNVDTIMKSGMEIVAIGIMSDAVREFYKDHIVIHTLQELPVKAMTKLSKILTKGMGK